MRITIFLLFLIHLFNTSFGKNDVKITEDSSFFYVKMEFRHELDKIPEKFKLFEQECIRQHIDIKPDTSLMFICSRINDGFWSLGYPVNKGTSVSTPLKIAQFNAKFTAKKNHIGSLYALPNTSKEVIKYIRLRGYVLSNEDIHFFRENPGEIYHESFSFHSWYPLKENSFSDTLIGNAYTFSISLTMFLCFTGFMIFLFASKKDDPRILLSGLLLIVIFLTLSHSVFNIFSNYIYDKFPHVLFIGRPFFYAIAPLILLYLKALFDQDFKLQYKHILHFIPFLIFFLYFSWFYYRLDAEEKQFLAFSYKIYQTSETFIILLLWNLQMIIYGYYSSKIILKHKNILALCPKPTFNLILFLSAFGITYPLLFFIDLSVIFLNLFHEIYLTYIFIFIYVFLSLSLIMYIIKKKEIHESIRSALLKYNKQHQLSGSIENNNIILSLKNIMHQEKIYLDPQITLRDLAEKLNTSPYIVSQLLNDVMKTNFFEFVNSYRLEQSKLLLEKHAQNGKTVLEILYESGFNSKSVFNDYFKKHTGMTPTQYKKKCAEINPEISS